MYQMTLFFKKVIYKKIIIYTMRHKIAHFFLIFLEEHILKHPWQRDGFTIMCQCTGYCKFTFQKKNLDLLSNSVYSPGIHVQIN